MAHPEELTKVAAVQKRVSLCSASGNFPKAQAKCYWLITCFVTMGILRGSMFMQDFLYLTQFRFREIMVMSCILSSAAYSAKLKFLLARL